MKKIFYFFMLVFILTVKVSAQSGSPDDYSNYVSWAWKGSFDPYIEAFYGVGSFDHKDFIGEFAQLGNVELRIGYGELKELSPNVVSSDERFLFGGYSDNNIGMDATSSDQIETKMWTFGVGNRLGYGYELSIFGLIPYSGATFKWTKLQTIRPENLSEVDNEILDLYEDSFRFGHSLEAGAKFELAKSLAVTAQAEGNVIFPRHLAMKWFGSFLIASAASGIVTHFSEDIVKSSPAFGPIIYFLLKNAVSAGYYYALKDQMNWPFTSATPLTYESLKLSATIRF